MISEHDHPCLSVVFPCWNEAGNLERGVLDDVFAFLSTRPFFRELIIVDDGSTDGSWDLVQQFAKDKRQIQHLSIPHGGKPQAVWAGIQAAQGELVLFADMDQSTPIGEVEKLLPYYDQGCDVVIGSRGSARDQTSLLRKIGSTVFTTFRRSLLLRGIRDTQCGFKSCRRDAALHVFPRLSSLSGLTDVQGWKVSAYDVEMLFLFTLAGYRVQSVNVEWCNRDVSEKGKKGAFGRYVHESIEMLGEVLRVKQNQVWGRYRDLVGTGRIRPGK